MGDEKITGPLYFFTLMFMVALFVCGLTAAEVATAYRRTQSAQVAWVESEAIIRSVKHGYGGGGSGPSINILYSYQWGGGSFEGRRYSFYRATIPEEEGQLYFNKFISSKSADRIIPVYVNPQEPQQSVIVMESLDVLKKRLYDYAFWAVASLIGFLVGVGLILYCNKRVGSLKGWVKNATGRIAR